MPEADTERHTEYPVGPDEEDQGEALDWLALLTRIHPRQVLYRGRKGLGEHRIAVSVDRLYGFERFIL